MALVAKERVREGLLLWSRKSQTSIPSVLVMKMTPGLVGENAPQVLWEPKVLADLKMGNSNSCIDVFHTQKLKSCTVISKSS